MFALLFLMLIAMRCIFKQISSPTTIAEHFVLIWTMDIISVHVLAYMLARSERMNEMNANEDEKNYFFLS